MRCSIASDRRFQIGFLLSLLIWGEWLSYELYAFLYWPSPENGEIKVLIIADPQLIGYQNENWMIGWLTRWDSDRFIARGYHLAKRYSNADTFIFLGDLFDEGVEASAQEFDSMVDRFVGIFQTRGSTSPHFFIVGDNDIGGEMEPVMEHLKTRFARTFANILPKTEEWNSISVNEINFFENPSKIKRLFGSEANNNTKILLSHVPISPGLSFQPNEITQSAPNLILSAHEHDAWKFVLDMKNRTLQTVQLNEEINKIEDIIGKDAPTTELQTPTCSYRMGTTTIGYGALYLRKLSSSQFQYTYNVLWLPSRFPQLILYLLSLVLFILLHVSRLFTRRKLQKYYSFQY